MKPANKHEEEIARKVDLKARATQDGVGAWDDRVITEVRIALGFGLDEAEYEFLETYVAWRRGNPVGSHQ